MPDSYVKPPLPVNEPVKSYAPGSPETIALKTSLAALRTDMIDIPLIIGGREVRTGKTYDCIEPHDIKQVRARAHMAGPKEIEAAIESSLKAQKDWAALPFEARAAVFLKAADLLAGPWRARINAATMLGQSKTPFQAEIDAACELIDFFRFNAHYAAQIQEIQPGSQPGVWNRCEYRNLEGFVFAVTPFNFTSIAGNLPTAPALLGNVALWKPATTSLLSNYLVMRLLMKAGLPDGVINFVPGEGAAVGPPILANKDLAGIHFTGSTGTFNYMWRAVGENLAKYKNYPRLVGETGGKDFIFAHPSADVEALVVALLRGAFEYQGQKCSAASRAYIPNSLWPRVRDSLVAEMEKIRVGDPSDFSVFMGAVIDEKSWSKQKEFIEKMRAESGAKILSGGLCDKSIGYFVSPTLIETSDPVAPTMCEELFGPILTVLPYEDARLDEALKNCDATSPYALTGAIFAQDRKAIEKMTTRLRHSAGNLYINDKPTGAVVGQQPFGGSRMSGTNDKAGSMLNLLRWTTVRTIKETFVPPKEWRYPHMDRRRDPEDS